MRQKSARDLWEKVRRILPFRARREKFIVVAASDGLLTATTFLADFEQKTIEFQRSDSFRYEGSGSAIGEPIRRLLRRLSKRVRARIIVGLPGTSATTIHTSIVLVREKGKEPIDESDFDNRIAQGIWKLFDRERGAAAAKMQVGDLDLVMTDVKVKQVKLDGHRVLNPVGFRAKTMEIQYSMTFTPRVLLAAIREAVPARHVALMAEAGVMMADVLSRGDMSRHFLLATFFPSSTELFLVHGSTIGCVGTVSWGCEQFTAALARAFAVSTAVAQEMFHLYLLRQASPAVLRRIESLLADEFAVFGGRVREFITRYHIPTLYFFAASELPEFVFSPSSLRLALGRRVRILPVDEDFIRDRIGFHGTRRPDGGTAHRSLVPTLMAILEFYFLPQDDTMMNKVARRHARWLIQ